MQRYLGHLDISSYLRYRESSLAGLVLAQIAILTYIL